MCLKCARLNTRWYLHHQDSNVGEITVWWEKKKNKQINIQKKEGSSAFQNFYSILYSRQYFKYLHIQSVGKIWCAVSYRPWPSLQDLLDQGQCPKSSFIFRKSRNLYIIKITESRCLHVHKRNMSVDIGVENP